VKGGKDHIFLRLGLLRSPYSAQKNVAYAPTLSVIASARAWGESLADYESPQKRRPISKIKHGGIHAA
jgi:hypothetical protein